MPQSASEARPEGSGPAAGADLSYEALLRLKQGHPTLRLLAADNAPLIVSFLYQQFVRSNQRAIRHSELVSRLEDYLYHLRALYGEGLYPRNARQYLADWADEASPFLRMYYPAQGDEAELDLTPATEKAIEWLQDLQDREFVGTESRLLTVFQLLHEIVDQSETDPEARVQALERRKAEIDAEIARIRAGQVDVLDATQVRERFFQAEDTARKLLADFRQVEYNFRDLDRQTREQIALSDRPKGEMLDEIFAGHDAIRESDQGRSFRAFWELLMSPRRQEELEALVREVYGLESLREARTGDLLRNIRYFLLEAGEKIYQTNNRLVEQLRRYLDDQAWLENRRIMALVREIERNAVAVKDAPPRDPAFAEVDEASPRVELVMSRPLYAPPARPVIVPEVLSEGEAEVEIDALFRQTYVDEAALAAQVRRLLQRRSQVSLSEVLRRYPLSKGLAELVGYLQLASRDERAVIDLDTEEQVVIPAGERPARAVRLPRVVFTR